MGRKNDDPRDKGERFQFSHDFSPSYSSSRKPVPSKKELRLLCIQRDLDKKEVTYPDPDDENYKHLTVLR